MGINSIGFGVLPDEFQQVVHDFRIVSYFQVRNAQPALSFHVFRSKREILRIPHNGLLEFPGQAQIVVRNHQIGIRVDRVHFQDPFKLQLRVALFHRITHSGHLKSRIHKVPGP